MDDQTHFEITWESTEGDVELVGPQVRPLHFETVGQAYQHWKRCFAHLSDAPLVVHAKQTDGMERVMVRV